MTHAEQHFSLKQKRKTDAPSGTSDRLLSVSVITCKKKIPAVADYYAPLLTSLFHAQRALLQQAVRLNGFSRNPRIPNITKQFMNIMCSVLSNPPAHVTLRLLLLLFELFIFSILRTFSKNGR